MPDYSQQLYPLALSNGVQLRGLGVADAAKFWSFVVHNRAHLEEFDPFVRGFQSVGDVRATLLQIQERRVEGKSLTCGLWGDDELIGFLNAGIFADGGLRLGYGLAKGYEGKGVMTEAVEAVLRAAFALPEVKYAWLTCWPANVRSMGLAERLGFQRDETMLPPEPEDGAIPGRLRYTLINARATARG
jgi:ribosomal-protein-serine acetyltransferase